ncbi:rod-determining factor RdfA [Halovenus sp. HT40]|uniref:rod-determining factor RdfA n=1 Tax=Halovenus sp. HT40 TaxID=3126691 RepID=UPI003FA5AF6D
MDWINFPIKSSGNGRLTWQRGIEQLRDNNQLTLGEFQTLADSRIVCEDCNSQFDILELLDQGGLQL